MLRFILLAATVVLPIVAQAQSRHLFRPELITIPVNQIDRNAFEVIEADGAGGTQLWCAAAIYTRQGLGLRGGDLYVQQGRGPAQTMPGRKGVIFSTQPVPGAFKSVSQGVRDTGQTFTMAHAYALCRSGRSLGVRVRLSNGSLLRR